MVDKPPSVHQPYQSSSNAGFDEPPSSPLLLLASPRQPSWTHRQGELAALPDRFGPCPVISVVKPRWQPSDNDACVLRAAYTVLVCLHTATPGDVARRCGLLLGRTLCGDDIWDLLRHDARFVVNDCFGDRVVYLRATCNATDEQVEG